MGCRYSPQRSQSNGKNNFKNELTNQKLYWNSKLNLASRQHHTVKPIALFFISNRFYRTQNNFDPFQGSHHYGIFMGCHHGTGKGGHGSGSNFLTAVTYSSQSNSKLYVQKNNYVLNPQSNLPIVCPISLVILGIVCFDFRNLTRLLKVLPIFLLTANRDVRQFLSFRFEYFNCVKKTQFSAKW